MQVGRRQSCLTSATSSVRVYRLKNSYGRYNCKSEAVLFLSADRQRGGRQGGDGYTQKRKSRCERTFRLRPIAAEKAVSRWSGKRITSSTADGKNII